MNENRIILLAENECMLREQRMTALRGFGFSSVADCGKAGNAIDESRRCVGTSRNFHCSAIDLRPSTYRRECRSGPWWLSKELKAVNPKLRLISVDGHLTTKTGHGTQVAMELGMAIESD